MRMEYLELDNQRSFTRKVFRDVLKFLCIIKAVYIILFILREKPKGNIKP